MAQLGDRGQHELVTELDALLALAESGPLAPPDCLRLAELVAHAPGRLRRVSTALGRQRDAGAVEGLLRLPPRSPGVVEGIYQALRRGARRLRAEGGSFPTMMAIEFRSSSARRFPAILDRARGAFGQDLERLRVDGTLHYRVALLAEGQALRRRARKLELDLEGVHRELLRIRGVRVWINGWCFDDGSTITPTRRVALIRGWFDWAGEAR